ncbi:MAG: P13 family porin, partial [Treponema sp.]|nr:P13 family porin [Treponema sp.]
HLLDNLRQHYDINETFRKTMADVAHASNNEQRPALYTDFAETLYLDVNDQANSNQAFPQQTVTVINQNNPSSTTQFPNGLHYSTGRKIGAGFLNYYFGIGSFAMGDWKGGLLCLGLEAGAVALLISGSNVNQNGNGKAGTALAVAGGGTLLTAIITWFHRPFSYDKKISIEKGTYYADSDSHINQSLMNNLSISPVPTSDGNMGMGVLYKTSF